MIYSHAHGLIGISWLAFAAVWLIAALRTKPVETRQTRISSVSMRAAIMIGAILLFGWWHFGLTWMDARFVPHSSGLVVTGAVTTAAGICLALWSRYHLGRNWGSTVSIRVGHELVLTGPYAYLRHPIYVGLGLALAGTALADGKWEALAGMLIIVSVFLWKARVESEFLVRRFGEEAERR